MKSINNLEAIVESLNDKVGALKSKESELKEHIDMLIEELKVFNADIWKEIVTQEKLNNLCI